MQRYLSIVLLALPVAGCFTVSETPFPTITHHVDANAATNVSVSVRGFATTLTEYRMVDGYQTIFYDGGIGPYGGGTAVAHTTMVVPQDRASDAFLEQARNRLEGLGFNIMVPSPDYIVEARFTGPTTTAGDTAASVFWFVCTIFTCDHGAQEWSAHLKIHDHRTGRLVLARDYTQKYEATGFSPIPLLGISAYEHTSPNYMQCWCLSALTERMTVEAAEFLTRGK